MSEEIGRKVQSGGVNNASGKLVLVVDDDERILRIVRTILKITDYRISLAKNGEEAIKAVESEKPDVMLLDMVMSPVNGFDVLKRLRSFSALPVIAFSAHSSSCEEALHQGANDYITKPFRPKELIDKINSLTREE